MSAKKSRPAAATQPTANKVAANNDKDSSSAVPAAADDNPLKEETLKWVLSIVCSLLVYWVVAHLVISMYHPDTNAMIEKGKELLFDYGAVRPEPVESMLFRAGVVVILSCIAGFYTLFSKAKFIKDMAEKPVFTVLSSACFAAVLAMVYFDLAAQNPYVKGGSEMPQNARDLVGSSNFDFFFDGLFMGGGVMIYAFVMVPLLACLFLLGFKKYKWDDNDMYRKVVAGIGYTVTAGTILAIMLMHTFEFPYTFENKYDFSAAYYSVTQVFAGAPMLVKGFTNTYGLYPHFLNLIFQVIGLSILKFSLVMSILLGLAFAFNFLVLKKLVKNQVILFLGFASVVFIPFLDFKLTTAFDCVFAFFPIRYIIPSALTFLATVYLNKRSALVYWSTYVLMACFILWNPEIGMVCYLAWIAFHTYNDFYSADGKVAIKKIAMHWLAGAALVFIVGYTYKALIYLAYGSAPDMTLMYSTILIFSKIGFNMLPMVLVHPWNGMALTLILGFTYAITRWYNKDITAKASMIFLISIVGVGFFVYFQGRSHNWPFAWSSGFSWLLLAILGDELWDKIKNRNVLSLNILFVVFLFTISFSFFEIIFDIPKINELVYQTDDKEKAESEMQRLKSNTDFILKNAKEKEKIYIFSAIYYQALYFDGNKRPSAFNPGDIDQFSNAQLAALSGALRDSAYSIFIEPEYCANTRMVRVLPAAAATYEYKAVNQAMHMLVKRKTPIPAKSVLGNGEAAVIHKKYSDDTTGKNQRISDAGGTAPVTLGPEFSVEVVFKPGTQIFKFATLLGNMNDSSGFLIANVINTPTYFFGINGKGISFPLENTPWAYFAINVYPDKMEVYENGNLMGTLPLEKPMRQSPEKLAVGNMGFLRNYIGAISEICITNKRLDKNKIQATWEEVKAL